MPEMLKDLQGEEFLTTKSYKDQTKKKAQGLASEDVMGLLFPESPVIKRGDRWRYSQQGCDLVSSLS